MPVQRWNGTSFVDLSTLKRWSGSAWVDITLAKRWSGSAWVDLTLPGGSTPSTPTATANRTLVSESVQGVGLAKTITTPPVTVSVVGGTAPYTYAWTRVSGNAAISADSDTSSSTTFSGVVPRDNTYTAKFRCTVTDALSATDYIEVIVSLTYTGPEPGTTL